MLGYSALLLLTCLSCTDRGITAPEVPVLPDPPATAAYLAGRMECTVVVASGEITCTLEEPRTPAGISPALLGGGQVKMASSNVHRDTLTSILSFDATVQNLLAEPIGTPDGSTKTGIKVFFHSGPTATSYAQPGDTGTVRVANADGTISITRKDQPYHYYDTILLPNQTSSPKNWKFDIPRTVLTFEFGVFIFAAMPGEPRVPAVPPDSVPEWVYADSNMTNNNSPHMAGRFPRNVLWVIFDRSATQEEIQAAIDFAGVEVIGGDPVLRAYLVRVQDDGTTYPLFKAREKLESLPQVRFMFVDLMLGGTHLRPSDETNGWNKDAWSLNPDLAGGPRWGLERIRAPLAWGCETGDSTLKIAVVDYGFQDVDDLRANAPGATVFGKWPGEKHGTEVASVLGARGDNGLQMTGLMWRAHLQLFDSGQRNDQGKVAIGLRRMARAVVDAGTSADIINISNGIWWQRDRARMPYTEYVDNDSNPAKDSADVRDAHIALFSALYELESKHNRRPLIVLRVYPKSEPS